MGAQKKQDSDSSNSDIDKIQREIQNLSKITDKLQANYKIMSKSLKDINKSIKFLTKTVQSNKDFIDRIPFEKENPQLDGPTPLSEGTYGERVKIDRKSFLPALKRILLDLKNNGEKEYIDIKTVKKAFMEWYYLEFETEFDQWLLESYWSNEIELFSGMSNYSVRDIYDNVYHHIKF
ncbi:MAG: hypothetical protein EU530_04285 [Promethearchaeota archaeon]|nr:MAG: hypothetical protein EU530_04285 [Candidatus Lokiarchaeota archaeon]